MTHDRTLRIALIGDYNPEVTAHRAIPLALQLAGSKVGYDVVPVWCHTAELREAPTQLTAFDGLWCVPASPYASMENALNAIRFAREQSVPFLGTCGGFQHAIIEYARNVRGLSCADHAETNPAGGQLVIAPLLCSLVEASQEITTAEGSLVRRAYGSERIVEQYRCRYGLNPAFRDTLFDDELWPTAHDENGEVRAVELRSHPFFVATLFQPERRALVGEAPPIAMAFLGAVLAERDLLARGRGRS